MGGFDFGVKSPGPSIVGSAILLNCSVVKKANVVCKEAKNLNITVRYFKVELIE